VLGQFARSLGAATRGAPEKVPAVGEDWAMAKRIRGPIVVIYQQTGSVSVIHPVSS
jgi:hypothetical protein